MTDTLTVIRSRHLRLAKTIHADGRIDDYDRAKTKAADDPDQLDFADFLFQRIAVSREAAR